MRLPLLSPASLSPEQQKLSEDMRQGIESNFKGFQAINSEGALIGPWNPWLRFSKFGGPIWELVKALSTSPTLPRPVREVAILVTGAHFHSAYELYAHVLIAEARGLPDEKIATIVAGQRPADLSREEAVAYDVASALVSGSVLPELVYRQAVATFGEEGTAELIYLVGLYCLVSVTLNGFDVLCRRAVEERAPEPSRSVDCLLVGADPDRFFVPPYVGHKGWVGVRLDLEPTGLRSRLWSGAAAA